MQLSRLFNDTAITSQIIQHVAESEIVEAL